MGNTQSRSASELTVAQPAFSSDAGFRPPRVSRALPDHDEDSADSMPLRQPFITRRRSNLYGSIRQRMPSRRSAPMPDVDGTYSAEETGGDMDNEQENRPLVHEVIHATEHQDTSLPTSSPSLVRSPSTVSRIGSRLLPDSVARVLLSSGEETPAEGLALRNAHSEIYQAPVQRQISVGAASRFSLADTIRRRMDSRNEPLTEFRRRTIRGPFPLGATHQQLLNNDHDPSLELDRSLNLPTSISRSSDSLHRRPRMRRIRNSLSSSLSSLLDRSSTLRTDRPAPDRPARATAADDSDQLLPSWSTADNRPELEDVPHELDAVEPEARHILSPHITSGMSTIRRFNRLRSRSTRLMRPENPPLSQVLQLAAAAIAAQLSGHTRPATSGGRALGTEAFDDIQNFVQTLQEAASAQAGETIDVNAAEGDLPPVNFMRVFQFPNDEHGSPITSQAQSRNVDLQDMDQITASAESDRSVTLVLVGVRSMPHGHETGIGEHGGLGGPTLDNLLSLPFLPPSNLLGGGRSGAMFRRTDTRTRTNSRRHSMTNFSFPAQYESQRSHRPRIPGGYPSPEQSPGANIHTPLSESPPGPNPPPSTPADLRSGQATPVRRPSSASAVHTAALPDLDEDQVQASTDSTPDGPYNFARHRRRSDSGIARRPELGSGAARRNGFVGPESAAPGAGRSWLIYVVGTNVSPDHPAFTMPSLFTDNPSYEDMQMLSTLLGPVKPPVASEEDVVSSGGLFRIVLRDSRLLAEPPEDSPTAVALSVGERCLICLCDYEPAEEIRQLAKCQHTFHRECIDEWLTTGRNSCPMCRGQGVMKKEDATSSSAGPAAQTEEAT